MTIKQLLIASCILSASLTQAVSMKNFDRSTLVPYIIRAQKALEQNAASATKKFKKTYTAQKSALNIILQELKYNVEYLKTTDNTNDLLAARQLYKAFKDVYKNWKKTQSLPVVQDQYTV